MNWVSMLRVIRNTMIICVIGAIAWQSLAQSQQVGKLSPKVIGKGEVLDTWELKERMRELAREKMPDKYEELKSIHTLMGKPRPGEWLTQHQEQGMSLKEYFDCYPVRPGKIYTTIYIQPVGPLGEKEQEILRLSAEYMAIYFNVPVKVERTLPLSLIPAGARREQFGTEQLQSRWILQNLLRPRRPKDALAYIALTARDLWPGEGWNFVYGQASLRERVGVWSMHRNGDPSESEEMFKRCLRRTIKTATHETGHILTMKHCIAYRCNMNGSNHREESDATPLALCPLCLYKLSENVQADPVERINRLEAFCKRHGLEDERRFFEETLQLLN